MSAIGHRIEHKYKTFPIMAARIGKKFEKVGTYRVKFTFDVLTYEGGYEDWSLVNEEKLPRKV